MDGHFWMKWRNPCARADSNKWTCKRLALYNRFCCDFVERSESDGTLKEIELLRTRFGLISRQRGFRTRTFSRGRKKGWLLFVWKYYVDRIIALQHASSRLVLALSRSPQSSRLSLQISRSETSGSRNRTYLTKWSWKSPSWPHDYNTG